MIQSLARGLEIMNILLRKNSATLTEIALELGINKSSVSRLIGTLKHYDMVQLDRVTKKYRLGLRMLNLSEGVKRNIEVISVARPYLFELSDALGESVHLCSLSNNQVYVVDQIRSNKAYTLSATVGMVEPMHCSSVGKCILAYRRPEVLPKMLEGYDYVKYTDRTITDYDSLMKELEQIRRQGYAVDNEEVTRGICCLAAPIYNYRGSVTYSLGISSLSARITPANIDSFVKKLVAVAAGISAALKAT
jgi:DNA-binding IclR family transcriptional regulator